MITFGRRISCRTLISTQDRFLIAKLQPFGSPHNRLKVAFYLLLRNNAQLIFIVFDGLNFGTRSLYLCDEIAFWKVFNNSGVLLAIKMRNVYICNLYWKFRLLIPDKDHYYCRNDTTNSFVVKKALVGFQALHWSFVYNTLWQVLGFFSEIKSNVL